MEYILIFIFLIFFFCFKKRSIIEGSKEKKKKKGYAMKSHVEELKFRRRDETHSMF